MTHIHDTKCSEGLQRYCAEATANIVKEMASAKAGNRNDTLYKCALAIGQIAVNGFVDVGSTMKELIATAIASGLPPPEAHLTARSGYENGKMKPRDLSRVCRCGGNRARRSVAVKSQSRERPAAIAAPSVPENATARRADAVQAMEAKLRPGAGTPTEIYLSGRGLAIEQIDSGDLHFAKDLAYHEDGQLLGYYDALVARVRSFETGEIITHQRTYLAANGEGKAAVPTPKKAVGPISGGAIFLGDIRNAEHVGYAEGLEDAATGRIAVGIPVAAVMGKGMFARVVPAPNLRRATIFADAGDDARVAVGRLADRLLQQSIAVRIVYPPIGRKDLNALLMAEGIDAVRRAIEASAWREPIPADASWAKSAGREDWRYDSTCVADIEARNVEWLWEPRIAIGKLSMVFGNPGQGKSQLTSYLAARVTTGTPFADGASCAIGSVIMIACEDDVADTIRPRLSAAGADLRRVHILNAVRARDQSGKPIGTQLFSLAGGIEDLERMIDDIGDAKMIVIDPVTAYLDGTDSHKNSDVRGALMPIQLLAAEKKLAVVMVTHMNKAVGQDAMARVTGSGAFVAAARAAFLVGRDRNDQERRLFVPAKNNLGDDRTGLAFKIEPCVVEGDIKTSRIVMDGTPIDITADDIVSESVGAKQPKESSALSDAKRWLCDLLRDGRMPATVVMSRAKEEGLAEKTVRNAMRALGGITRREGYGGQGVNYWSLHSTMSATTHSRHHAWPRSWRHNSWSSMALGDNLPPGPVTTCPDTTSAIRPPHRPP